MSVRQRREVLDTLSEHFKVYKLPATTTYSGYMQLVSFPVLPRAIRKTYGNWSRAVKAVQLANPELFAPAPKKVEPKVAPKAAPKAAPKKVAPKKEAVTIKSEVEKVSTASEKPVESLTVKLGNEDGKNI